MMNDGVLGEVTTLLLPFSDVERELLRWTSGRDEPGAVPLGGHGDETVDVDELVGGGFGGGWEGSGEGSVAREEGRSREVGVESPGEVGFGPLSVAGATVRVLLDEVGSGEVGEEFGFEDAGRGRREVKEGERSSAIKAFSRKPRRHKKI